jgi:hypothetical protein
MKKLLRFTGWGHGRASGRLEGPIAGTGSEVLIAGRCISPRAPGKDADEGGGAMVRRQTNRSRGTKAKPGTGIGLGEPGLRGRIFGWTPTIGGRAVRDRGSCWPRCVMSAAVRQGKHPTEKERGGRS